MKQLKEIQNTVLNLQKVAAKVEEGSVRTSNSPLTPNTYEENTQDPPNTYTKGVSHMSPFPRSLPITTEVYTYKIYIYIYIVAYRYLEWRRRSHLPWICHQFQY